MLNEVFVVLETALDTLDELIIIKECHLITIFNNLFVLDKILLKAISLLLCHLNVVLGYFIALLHLDIKAFFKDVVHFI